MKNFFLVLSLVTAAAPSFSSSTPRLITGNDFFCHGQAGRSVDYKGRTYSDCGGGHGPAAGVATDLLGLVNRFQARLGRTLRVTSGYRCDQHNLFSWAFVALREGGEGGVSLVSLHRAGAAADIIVEEARDLSAYRSFEKELKKLAAAGGGGMLPVDIWTRVYGPGEVRDPDNLHDSPYIHVHLLGVARRALPPDSTQ